jgi:peptidoglycan/LPS O-acetylase OafA/YrhL
LEDKLNKIDNWRGVLALLVLFCHSIQLLCSNRMSKEWMICLGPIAHISVLLFFFFSGFVIFSSLEQRFKIKKNTTKVFINYIQARLIRIYPPLFGILIITIIFKFYIKLNYSKLPDEFMFSIQDIINYTLMFKVSLGKINAPLWTLILEWWLYILGFFIYCILITKTLQKIIFGFLLIFLTSFITFTINDHFLVYFLIWTLGALFYFTKIIKQHKILFIISTLCFTYTFFYENILFNGIDISNKPYLQILVIFSFIGILFIFKRNKILAFVSSFSYSIYIVHYPFFIFIKLIWFKTGTNNWYELIFIDIIVVSISFFFSRIFENKKRFLSIIYSLKLKYYIK